MKKRASLGKECTLLLDPESPDLKLTNFWIQPPEIIPFYRIVSKPLDKPINLNLNILDLWLFLYLPLYIAHVYTLVAGISSVLSNFYSKIDCRNKSDSNNLFITQNCL